jgi:hypothetical protein
MLPDLVQVVARVVEVLEGAGVPCVVGGSLASSQFGIPRSTRDTDTTQTSVIVTARARSIVQGGSAYRHRKPPTNGRLPP